MKNEKDYYEYNSKDVESEQIASNCKNQILRKYGEIRKEYYCSLKSMHKTMVDFIIYPVILFGEKPKELLLYEERNAKYKESQIGDNLNAQIDEIEDIEMNSVEKEAEMLYDTLYNALIIKKDRAISFVG